MKDYVKLFSTLLIIRTNVFVAHGRFLSRFKFEDDQFKLSEKHIDYHH
jgi:hypothetical protein